MSQLPVGNPEAEANSTSLPLSLHRTRWTTRLPEHYRDMLPKPYMPLPPSEFGQSDGEAPHVHELPSTSVSNDFQAATATAPPSRIFKSQANSYGLFWLYNHDTLPANDPEDTSGSADCMSINSDADPFHPYPNESLLLLGDWYWNQGTMKSRKSFRRLLKIVGSSKFRSSDIWDTKWTKIDHKLRALVVAPDVHTSTPWSSLEWLNHNAGWKSTPVTISIPFSRCPVEPGPAAYSVWNFYHHSLISVIREKVIDLRDHRAFHYEPYVLHWHLTHKTCEMGVHGELFTLKSFIDAHNQLQSSLPKPGCELPRHIVALMFWSNATQLTVFGDVKLWPLYMYFGNESKYTRCQPSAHLCNHVAYFQTVCCYCIGKWLATDIPLSFLMTSRTLFSIISKISDLVMLSLHIVIGNCSTANGKKYLTKNLFRRTSMESS